MPILFYAGKDFGTILTLSNVTVLLLYPLQSLLLLHYLIRNGSERVVTSAREHVYDMKPLEEFTFRDEQGKDQGVNGMSWWGVDPGHE